MPSEEKERKKKRSKAKKVKKPKKNEHLNSYSRVDFDESDEEKGFGEIHDSKTAAVDVPYPEVDDAPRLTINGNSLPNVPRVHPKPKGVIPATSRVLNTCWDRSQCGSVDRRCLGVLMMVVIMFIVFLAGISYEEHVVKTDPPMVHDGNSDQTGYGPGDGPDYGDHGPGSNGSNTIEYSQRQKDIIMKLKQLSGDVISYPNTPYHQAAHWMLWIDKSEIEADSPFLWQRYTLALLYYKTGDGNNRFKLKEEKNECDWEKVGCTAAGYVEHLSLENCDMSGPIPALEIQSLRELSFLDLSSNHLSGDIPDSLMDLLNMKTLLLDDNDLVGKMPAQICSLVSKGQLTKLTSDCTENKVFCSCCINCPNQIPDVTPDDGHYNLTPRQTLILDKLKQLSGETSVTMEGTVQHKAAQWIMKVDEMELDANSPNLFQRYTLALLHFMMPDNNKCYDMHKDEEECDWESKSDSGVTWKRISCDNDDHVKYLKLDSCGLNGPIPSEIQALSNLDYLDLSKNKLTGQVPLAYQNLHKLVHMYLEENSLTGDVPESVCQLRDNAELLSFVTDCLPGDRSVNCDCCTNCPIEGDADGPEDGNNGSNDHFESLNPGELAIMNKLRLISGHALDVVGTPEHNAAHFIMKEDSLKLTANDEFLYQRYVVTLLGEMSGSQDACFERESGVSECNWLSKGLGGVTWERIACDSNGVLEYLKLDGCGISGGIPSEIEVLSKLNYLDLSNNAFSGNVPDELSALTNLGHLYLEKNSLVGEVPEQVCDLRNYAKLMKFNTDCTNDDKKILCECCTNCVNTDTTEIDTRQEALLEKLKGISGNSVTESGTVQSKAANWIMFKDTKMLTASSKQLYQRYALAVLYFMMGNERWFTLDAEAEECMWERIGCDTDGRVNYIKFDHCDMHGPIPHEISVLTELEHLDLSGNSIDGGVVDELETLQKLKTLYLENNIIVGAVPSGICTRKEEGLLVDFTTDCGTDANQKVQCSCCDNCAVGLPPSPGLTDEETRIQAIKGMVTTLSNGVNNVPNTPQNLAMKWIMDDDKQHSNVGSPHFAQRYVIAVIYFSIGGEGWINSFWLSPQQNECDIPGVQCNSVGRITKIEFTNQGMAGNLPAEIEHLFELNTIDFSDNDVAGNIPSQWSSLNKLTILNLKNTKLTGEVPSSICSLRSDALVSFDIDCSEVVCSCCTNCDSGSRSTDIRDKVKAISFKSDLSESPKFKSDRADAMDWISHVDKFDIDVSTDEFNERYILAVFYFSLNGSSWVDVMSPNVNWLNEDRHHCDWKGVVCDGNKYVIVIQLRKFPVNVEHHLTEGCLH